MKQTTRILTLSALIVLAILSRFIPHPPNFSPITSIALFSGAYFSRNKIAFLIPLIAMLLSDLFLGIDTVTATVYLSFGLITLLGTTLHNKASATKLLVTSVSGSTLFFMITNFGVWAFTSLYPKTAEGLFNCYLAGIPFFKNTVSSSLIYSVILFGSFAIFEKKFFQEKNVQSPVTC